MYKTLFNLTKAQFFKWLHSKMIAIIVLLPTIRTIQHFQVTPPYLAVFKWIHSFRLCQTQTCIKILASDTGKHVLIDNINNHDNKLLILKTLTQDQFCLVINCIFPKQIAILTRLCLLTMLKTNKTIQFYGP